MIVAGVEVLFWVSVAAVAWSYVLYPVSVVVLSRLRPFRHNAGAHEPSVSLIISAYNEASVIGEKIENALDLDYPDDKLEIIVISDASDDGTDQIVLAYAQQGVRLLRQDKRGGKSRGLTRFVPEARGEVLVFSDANSMYAKGAIRALVRHFVDPRVGYVVGCQKYFREATSPAADSEDLYWRYEMLLKECEGRLGSVVGGDGAIYAIRASLFRPLEDHDISDFVNPLQIVAAGYRGVFEREAVCFEKTAGDFGGEFRRKVRIVNRALTGLLKIPAVMNPFRCGWFSYEVIAHKLIRWFVPYFLVIIFVSNAYMALANGSPFWKYALAGQALFYAMALLGLAPYLRSYRLFYVPYYFCLVNVAALVGTLGALSGRKYVVWSPERS